MTRPSRTGGKTSAAKARNAGPAKGRKTTKTKPRIAPAATRVKRRSISEDLKEAREQQAATAEILKVIAGSPSDVQPVLEAVAERAMRLLDAWSVLVTRFDGELLHFGAARGALPDTEQFLRNQHPMRPEAAVFPGRCILERSAVNISDAQADPSPQSRERARLRGFRAHLSVPMLRDGQPNGVISVSRREAGAFAANEVELLQTFADQAVIAIENVRLFNETQEALERQTATADILKVIASSPDDAQPVFEAIATSANRLVGGFATAVFRLLDGTVHLAAFTPVSPAADAALKGDFPRPVDEFEAFRLAKHGKPFPIPDTEEIPHAPIREIARLHGFRSMLYVPLMNDGVPIGVISVTRVRPGTFADYHVQLLRTFADQAVIAIQNAQMFEQVQAKTRDLTEALTYQTGSANILSVIASSPTDVGPVLDAIVESASELCEADDAIVFLKEGGDLRSAAHSGPLPEGPTRVPITRSWMTGRSFLDRKPVHVRDLLSADGAEFPDGQKIARSIGFRTMLTLPLLREGESIGVILLRRKEVHPFHDKQIALLQTFADQAVIAIGNVHMFEQVQAKTRDLSEALTYQTGSANILNVIASSPTDVQPVLKAIVKSACELCEAYDAVVILKDGEELQLSAHQGPIPMNRIRWPNDRSSASGRAMADQRPVHVHDVLGDEGRDFAMARDMSIVDGCRTLLSAPMLREGEAIGAIALRRAEVHPFSDKQIALLQTFADQAVIAIGNVRLFEEVQAKTRDLSESLQQQTATADVLKVISRSAFDLQTVLDTLLASAATLCEAEKGVIFLREDSHFLMVSNYGFSAEFEAFARAHPYPADSGSTTTRSAASGVTVHVADVLADDTQSDLARQYQRLGGHRTIVGVPLRRERETIGVFTLTRQVVHPFTERQIELVETFADQAVIAIQNVRLFDEVQAKTRDLTESLQQQTATADVLKVISASPGELEPVFQAMLENAVRLCEAQFAMLFLYEKEKNEYRAVGKWNLPPEWREFLEKNPLRADPRVPLGRIAITKQPVQVTDVLADQAYIDRYPGMVAVAELGGARTLLQVPLLKENELVGAFGIYRQEVRPFTDKQIALVRNFAAQAVIAMENARLLNELRQRTADLSESLNDLRTAQDRLIQTEKLASLGQLTAGIAHEIKNPLNFVNNFSALSAELTVELKDLLKSAAISEKMREDVDELTGMLKDNLEKVVQHGKRADSIVKNMLLHSREGSGEHRLADINAIVDESLNLAYHGARAEKPNFNVTMQRNFDPAVGTADVYPQEITRVLLNLISNGFYATAKRKTKAGDGFEPTLLATTKDLGENVEIRIRDNGTGIPDEVKVKIFNPFFTTKPAGDGTGLGLSMSHDIIVKQHGGRIDVDTKPGIFTEFIITLPRTIIPPKTAGGTN